MDGSLPPGSLDRQMNSSLVPNDDGAFDNVGIALFDNEGQSERGWACVHGDRPFRIKSSFSLPTNVLWWTNLPYGDAASRANRVSRHSGYFKVTMEKACHELGLRSLSPEETVERLSLHFAVLTSLAKKISRKSLSALCTSQFLYRDLGPTLQTSPLIPAAVMSRMRAQVGWDSWTQIEPGRHDDTIMLRVPRIAHMAALLSTHVPEQDVSWRQKPDQDPLEIIRNSLAPVYAEFSISNASDKPARLFGLAAAGGAGGSGTMARGAAAHPELIALDKFSELRVRSIYSGNRYVPASTGLPAEVVAFLEDRASMMSWSAGILAENIMRAIMGPLPSRDGGAPNMTWRGLWLRAADKTLMFLHAMAFHAAGYRPLSYGYGWIKLARPQTATSNAGLLSVAVRRGLVPEVGAFDPQVMADISRGTYGPASPDTGWGPGAFTAHVALTGNQRLLQVADDMPLLSGESRKKREDQVGRLISEHGKSQKG